MKKVLVALAGLYLFMPSAQATELASTSRCAVHYTRTACPGQEDTSYKKCDGKQSCVKFKEADSVAACQAAATKSCRNRRLNITKLKVITATFDGQKIQTSSGKSDFCLDYEKRAEEFDRCDAQ